MSLTLFNEMKYFQSNLLNDNNFKHAFFTRRSLKNEPKELQNQLNLNSNIHYLKQIHSDKIIQVNNNFNSKNKIGDSLITQDKNQSLWIYTADCLPILIADVKNRNIAACHSGLDGLKKQIISKTLNRLEGIGSIKSNLIIAIGPSIKGEKYQVRKKDVEDLIFQISGKSYIEKSCYILHRDKEEEEIIPLYIRDPDSERLLFDIQVAAILQLLKEGIKQSKINVNRYCTYSNPKLLNSYRRDRTNQRQWSCLYS